MKNRKMLDIMNLINDDYIKEADPNCAKAKKSKFKWTTLLASAACLLLILNIAIIVPLLTKDKGTMEPGNGGLNHIENPNGNGIIQNPTHESNNHIENPDKNQNSETPPEIENDPSLQFVKNPTLINALNQYFEKNKNNLGDMWLEDAMDKNESNEEMDDVQEELNKDQSTDINDNQVGGISEGDIVKKSDKHIFYLRHSKLYIYSINGKQSQLECMYPLTVINKQIESFYHSLDDKYNYEEIYYYQNLEMYLSSDYKTLTVIVKPGDYSLTGVITFDVSFAPSIEVKDFKIFSGHYVTSRMVNDELLLFTKYTVYKGNFDSENPLTYIPYYTEDGKEYLTDHIYFPNELSANTYITISRVSADGLLVKESVSYLSYNSQIYVSHNNIYLARQMVSKNQLLKPIGRTPYETEIAVVNYQGDWFINKGTVKVEGYIKNQYNLDEYQGVLRIVTTSYMPGSNMSGTLNEELLKKDSTISTGTTASLYCIDLESMTVVASVLDFAPVDEIVRSVRFDKTNAYVCTSYEEVLRDPVFFFDLSDLSNITYTDTGEIDGYSDSLINIGGGYVVGIGYGESASTLKIEVFKEVGDKVETVCVEEFAKTYFSTDYKSYYIDRERHLIGLAISTYYNGSYLQKYLLLYFNGSHFEFVINNEVPCDTRSQTRGFYQNNYFYIVTDKAFSMFYVGNMDELPFISADGVSVNGAESILPSRDPTKPAW